MLKKVISYLLLFTLSISLLIFPASAEEPEINVKAKAAVLMDAASGKVLYAMNEHERLYPASVTKIMAMLLFAEAIDSGRMTLEETVTAS
ncbi:MAG: serine hydrolase, partial [Clostridia bacterium]|nr:serine hydrolase [Clostridia bacterium]